MNDRLIYDAGMHVGQDTAYYLAKGFDVVAIEANPLLSHSVGEDPIFAEHVAAGRLIIINKGVGDREGVFPFYINALHGEWSSFDEKIGSRGGCREVIQIEMVPLSQLFGQYGVPYYLKIDIETGKDIGMLRELAAVRGRPRYVSIENGWPDMVRVLVDLGYTGFKFINQANMPQIRCPSPAREGRDIAWQFAHGSSGPFGEDTPGEWRTAKEILGEVTAYWSNPRRDPEIHGWYDLHARLGSPWQQWAARLRAALRRIRAPATG